MYKVAGQFKCSFKMQKNLQQYSFIPLIPWETLCKKDVFQWMGKKQVWQNFFHYRNMTGMELYLTRNPDFW